MVSFIKASLNLYQNANVSVHIVTPLHFLELQNQMIFSSYMQIKTLALNRRANALLIHNENFNNVSGLLDHCSIYHNKIDFVDPMLIKKELEN